MPYHMRKKFVTTNTNGEYKSDVSRIPWEAIVIALYQIGTIKSAPLSVRFVLLSAAKELAAISQPESTWIDSLRHGRGSTMGEIKMIDKALREVVTAREKVSSKEELLPTNERDWLDVRKFRPAPVETPAQKKQREKAEEVFARKGQPRKRVLTPPDPSEYRYRQ